MSLMGLLLATEDMQSQQRAQNGVEEIVIGYFSDNDDLGPDELPEFDVSEFDGMITETSIDQLPKDIQAIIKAEHHRLTTGEIKKSSEFMNG